MTGAIQDRLKSAALVALFHVLLGLAFLNGLALELVTAAPDRLKTFDVLTEPPPPIADPPPRPRQEDTEEGEAAPPNLKAQPTPVVAPEPIVKQAITPPLAAAPTAGQGSAPSAGAAAIAGPGTGAGGEGSGTGSGGQGRGTGSGGAAAKAQWLSGSIRNRDYPRSASNAGAEGTVIAHFTVEADGRVTGCRIMSSSGHPDLDSTTCDLIERRFRFRPARDAEGRPIAAVSGWRQVWWLERRR